MLAPFDPIFLNRPDTPMGRGEDPSLLFSGGIEKIKQYLEQYGTFQVLAQLGPHCYRNQPALWASDTRVLQYWPENATRNPNPSLRLIKVVSIETCPTNHGILPVVCYRVRNGHIEETELYISSYGDFCIGLDAVKKDLNYQRLLDPEFLSFPAYLKMSAQRLFNQYFEETNDAFKSYKLLVDLHASLPMALRDPIEHAWSGVGVGEQGLKDAQNCRW